MNTTKKALCILLSGAALGMAAPAFADNGHRGWDRGAHGHGYGHAVYYGPRYVAPRVIVAPPVYYPAAAYYSAPPVVYAPAPVYAAPPVVYGPAPVYGPNPGAAVGAVAGAVIGSQFGHGGDRIATTAVGAIIGGILGSGF